jgi:hypothetical protein
LANRLSHDVHEVADHLVENAALGLQVLLTFNSFLFPCVLTMLI